MADKDYQDAASEMGHIDVVTIGPSYLNVCAHCNQCLNQIVSSPGKLNVVLHYKNDDGKYVEWKPSFERIAERNELIFKLRIEGQSLGQISKKVGITRQGVLAVLNKLERNSKRISEESHE